MLEYKVQLDSSNYGLNIQQNLANTDPVIPKPRKSELLAKGKEEEQVSIIGGNKKEDDVCAGAQRITLLNQH